jgi:ornithine cyclodeaminase/alanine dehydrogenase-like protein (mu-crystallin family)
MMGAVTPKVLLFSRQAVRELLSLDDCIDAVERAFAAHGRGEAAPPASLRMMTGEGGFHVKAATLSSGRRRYFTAKLNGNFPANPQRRGLPAIQGLVLLADAETGEALAVMDSIEITILRTAAATAVAARRLARPESATVTVCGCGNQGQAQLAAISRVLPIRRVFAWDQHEATAAAFAGAMATPERRVERAATLRAALAQSDVCITCTPSRRAFVMAGDLRPGTFLAAVGADNPQKQEIDPALLAQSAVWVDSLDQAAKGGDLHHALAAGVMRTADVRGELGALVAGRIPGREDADTITVFDSTGVALEDAAAAIVVYERGKGVGAPRFLFDD